MTKKSYLVGITGGSGSGKTFFLNRLLKNFDKNEICLISQDNYYIPRDRQPKDENGVSNFDTPQSIDLQAFVNDIRALQNGLFVTREEYTFNNPKAVPQMLRFHPAPVTIVEGLFVFSHSEIRDLLDLKLYIEAKDHIRLKRRIVRDNEERGYDLEDVLYRYEKHVMPTFEKYIEPYKYKSDLIIANNTGFETALTLIVTFLKSKLN